MTTRYYHLKKDGQFTKYINYTNPDMLHEDLIEIGRDTGLIPVDEIPDLRDMVKIMGYKLVNTESEIE